MVNNERGGVIVFVTLMVVLLMIMVGMGLDTGHLSFIRSQGQGAVDAAALSAVSGLANGGTKAEIELRATAFQTNNNYVGSPSNLLTSTNVSYVLYDSKTGVIEPSSYGLANGVRVALEKKNPYSETTVNQEIKSPLFLVPLFNLFGVTTPGTLDINVSAVATLTAKPSIPIAIFDTVCSGGNIESQTQVKDVQIRHTNSPSANACWTSYLSGNTIQDLLRATATCSGTPAGNIAVGTPIVINNGGQVSDYQEAYDLFIRDYPSKSWIVPIITEDASCTGQDPIVGWAKITPTLVVPSGSPNLIKADVYCGQSLDRTNDSRCFKPRLLRETKVGM